MKKIISIGLVVLCLLALTGCSSKAKVVFSDETVVEYGRDLLELVVESNADEITYEIDSEEYELNKEYTAIYTATKGSSKSTHELKVTFVDNTPPMFTPSEAEYVVELGKTLNHQLLMEIVSEVFVIEDNYKIKSIEIKDNEYDLLRFEYVDVVACDVSDNCSEGRINFIYKDITAPVITVDRTEFITPTNAAPKFLNHASAFDENDGVVSVTIEGEYDSSKPGVYNLKFVAVDEAGNRAEVAFTYTVTEGAGSQNGRRN